MKRISRNIAISVLLGAFTIAGADLMIKQVEMPAGNLEKMTRSAKQVDIPGWIYFQINKPFTGNLETYSTLSKEEENGVKYYRFETVFISPEVNAYKPTKVATTSKPPGDPKYGYAVGDTYDMVSESGTGKNRWRDDVNTYDEDKSKTIYLQRAGWDGDVYKEGYNSQYEDSENGLMQNYGLSFDDFETDSDHAFVLYKKLKAAPIDGEESIPQIGTYKQDYLTKITYFFTYYSRDDHNTSTWYAERGNFEFDAVPLSWSTSNLENAPKFGDTVYVAPKINYVDPEHISISAKLKDVGVQKDAYNIGEIKITLHNDQTNVDYGEGNKFDIAELNQEIIINKKDTSGKHDGKVWINGKESTNPLYTQYTEYRENEPGGEKDNFLTSDESINSNLEFDLDKDSDNPDKGLWNTTSGSPSNGRLVFWPEVKYNLQLSTEVMVTQVGAGMGMYDSTEFRADTLYKPYDIQQPIFSEMGLKNEKYTMYPSVEGVDDKFVKNTIEFNVDTQTASETNDLPTAKPTDLKSFQLVSRASEEEDWVESSDLYTFNQADFDVNSGSSNKKIELTINDQILKTGEAKEFAIKSIFTADDIESYSDSFTLTAPTIEPIGESNVQEFTSDENSYSSIDSENGKVNLHVKLSTIPSEVADSTDGGQLPTGVRKLEIQDTSGVVLATKEIDESQVDSTGLIDEFIEVPVDRTTTNSYKLKIYADAGIYTSTKVVKFNAPEARVVFNASEITNSGYTVINDKKVSTKLSFTIDGTTLAESDSSLGDLIATEVKSITIKGVGTTDIVIDSPTADANGVINVTTDEITLDQGADYNGVKVLVKYDELNVSSLTNQTKELIDTSFTTPGVNANTFTDEQSSTERKGYTPAPNTSDKGDVNYDVNYSFDSTSIKEIDNGDGTLNAPIVIDSLELTDKGTNDVLGTLNAGEFDYNEADGTVNAKFENVILKEATLYTLNVKTTWHYVNDSATPHENNYSDSFTTWEAGMPQAPTDISFTKGDFVNEVDVDGKETGTLSTKFNYSFDTTTFDEYEQSGYEDGETKVTGIKVTSSTGVEIEETNLTPDANGLYSGELELTGITPLTENIDFTLVITWDDGNETTDTIITESTPAIGVMQISDEDVVVNDIETSYSSMKFNLSIQDLDRASLLDKYEDYELSEVKITNKYGKEFIAENVNDYDPEVKFDTSILVTGLKPSNDDGTDTFAKQINDGEYKLIVNTVDGNGIEKSITIDEASNDINIDGQTPITPPTTEKPGDLDNIISEVNIKPETILEDGSFEFEVKIDVDDATFDAAAEQAFIDSFQLTYDGGKEIKIEPLQLVTTGTKAATTKVYASKASGLPAGNHEITASYKVEDKLVNAQVNVDFEGTTVTIPESSHFPWWIIIVILLLLTVIGAAIAAVFFFIILPWSIVPSETEIKTGNKVSITLNKKYDVVVEKLSDSYLYIEEEGYAYSITEDDKERAVINIDGLNMKKLGEVSNIEFSSDEKDIKVKGKIKFSK